MSTKSGESSAGGSSADDTSAADRPTILCVDDDPEILAMLRTRLSSRGYRILEATDGAAAVDAAREHHPNVVVLDVMMPSKSGWEVARELKQSEDTSNILIVMLTAIGESVNEMTAPLYGADAHIDKPFEFGELESTIAALIAGDGGDAAGGGD